MTPVLESDDYREEEEILKKDPIIIAMAGELLKSHFEYDLRGHEFMGMALEEYKRRGGTEAHSIGGPARAIRRLCSESGDERYKVYNDN